MALPRVTIAVGDPQRIAVGVAPSSFWSAVALFDDSLTDGWAGTPLRLRQAVTAGLGPRVAAAASLLWKSADGYLPDLIVPDPEKFGHLEDGLELHRSMTEAEIVRDLQEIDAVTPGVWGPALRQPTGWLRMISEGIGAIPGILGPRWHEAQGAVARERDRIAVGVATGAIEHVLESLTPEMRFKGGVLSWTAQAAFHCELGARRLVLIPMISGPRSILCHPELPDSVVIAYPAGSSDSLFRPRQAADGLSLVLGDQRAMILRALVEPRAMGELAVMVHVAPSTLSFHCNHLEAVGLIERRRTASQIRASLTTKGEELVALMDH